MSTFIRPLALVSESEAISSADVMNVAAALQKQATRDLAPIWDVSATVDAFDSLEDVPTDCWPMVIQDDIGEPGAAGIHIDRNGQPLSLITASDNIDVWSLTASHEMVEMLVDPFGNRLQAGDSVDPERPGRVNYLVEAADPCEAAEFAYSVNGVLVSDFYTPHYFDPTAAAGVRYSFTGSLTAPRQVLKGGYLSWQDPATDEWFQEIFFRDKPEFRDLGVLAGKGSGSLRQKVDRLTPERRDRFGGGRAVSKAGRTTAAQHTAARAGRAQRLREDIAALQAAAR